MRGGPARTAYISGQVSVDASNQLVGPGDIAVQADRAFANLVAALASVGMHPRDVVRLGIYVVGYRPSQAGVIRDALRRHFTEEPLPASTWLGVERLALDGFLIEVEATAAAD